MEIKLIRWGMAWVVASATLACSGSGSQVRGDGVSAEKHRETAARQARQAEVERSATAAPPNLAVTPSGNPEGYYLTGAGTGPEAGEARAQLLRKHAQEHLAVAAALESFEENECRTVPRDHRAACPLLAPVVRIEDVVAGVRVRFTDTTDMEQVLARMRCHLAFARARGFERVASCPLYVKGVEIQPSVPQSLEIVSSDAKVAARIRVLSREEAIVVNGAGD